jgi:hypothetical protein
MFENFPIALIVAASFFTLAFCGIILAGKMVPLHLGTLSPPSHGPILPRILIGLSLTSGYSYAIRAWEACLESRFHDHTSHCQTLHSPNVCRQLPLGVRRRFYKVVYH